MSSNDSSLFVFLLDRSGSMNDIKNDVEGAFRALIDEQKAVPGSATVSLHQFDDTYEDVFVGLPIEQVKPLVIRPRGTTALLDAIGRTVTATRERIAAMPAGQRPGTVHLNIMTDGLENASKEYTRPAIKALLEAQEKVDKWLIAYLGTNQDAVEVGTSLGISPERSLTYTSATVRSAMSSYSELTTKARKARRDGASPDAVIAGASFTDLQREEAGN
ncbi:vWA domain-containing protein [Paeniglutamicibacter cryotolerans]|uniref:VWA domain-containing protein n=1 Tax=Paeniglutamicibacter cryotolerans TaxID=670079 RepID=A0A839QFX4_9MICC|nr:vWA domain-containing protein [Paeniglutamicibacter cryotolerans]MBB2994790.1 hypothetical protein [Paeniglutamicibacter cryotolerans]